MTAAVRRLARTIYADTLVCACGEALPFAFRVPVGAAVRMQDVYVQSLECKRCAAVWGVQLHPRDTPHLRVQRLDRRPK